MWEFEATTTTTTTTTTSFDDMYTQSHKHRYFFFSFFNFYLYLHIVFSSRFFRCGMFSSHLTFQFYSLFIFGSSKATILFSYFFFFSMASVLEFQTNFPTAALQIHIYFYYYYHYYFCFISSTSHELVECKYRSHNLPEHKFFFRTFLFHTFWTV